jgi:hypothetical protein
MKWQKLPPTPAFGLGGVLFTPGQQRVLGLLFGQPDRRFQSSELIRLAASGTGAAHRLVTRLASVGLVTVERIGNQNRRTRGVDVRAFVLAAAARPAVEDSHRVC